MNKEKIKCKYAKCLFLDKDNNCKSDYAEKGKCTYDLLQEQLDSLIDEARIINNHIVPALIYDVTQTFVKKISNMKKSGEK